MNLSTLIAKNQDQLQFYMFITEPLEDALRGILHNKDGGLPVDSTDLYKSLDEKNSVEEIEWHEDQYALLFPADKKPDSKKFDVTLLCKLIKHFVNIPQSVKKIIERTLTFRNLFFHDKFKSLSPEEIENKWNEGGSILKGLDYKFDIKKLRIAPLDPVRISVIRSILELLEDLQEELKKDMRSQNESNIYSNLDHQQGLVKRLKENLQDSTDTLQKGLKLEEINRLKSELSDVLRRVEKFEEVPHHKGYDSDCFVKWAEAALPKLKGSGRYSKAQDFIECLRNRDEHIKNKTTVLNGTTLFIRIQKLKIGSSECSKVYIGFHKDIGWVAVKRCDKNKCTEQEVQFLEGYLSFPYPHQNIIFFVRSYEQENEDNVIKINIVMELCEENIQEWINKPGKQSIEKKSEMIFDFLDALQYLHNKGAVHRDLKPSNILINQGVLKISDFGITRIIQKDKTYKTIVRGTPCWVAPCFIGVLQSGISGVVKKEHDIFVALMIIYFILTDGQHPFQIAGEDDIFKYHDNATDKTKRKDCIKNSKLTEIPNKRNSLSDWFICMFNEWFKTPETISSSFVNEQLRKVLNARTSTPGARYAILLSNSLATIKADILSETCNSLTTRDEHTSNVVEDIRNTAINAICDTSVSAKDFVENIMDSIDHHEHILEGDIKKSEQLRYKMNQPDRFLTTPQVDIAFLISSLNDCNFDVFVSEDITTEKLYQHFDSIISKTEEDTYIFMHISGHAYYDDDASDTFVEFKDGKNSTEMVAVKSIMNYIKDNQNCKLILTADVCRKRSQRGGKILETIGHPVIAIYSQEKDLISADIAFATPSHFSGTLAEQIKPGKTLREIIQGIRFSLSRFDKDWPQPVVEECSDDSLLDFVF